MKKQTLVVQGAEVAIVSRHEKDFISLTDMVRKFGDESILYNWLRNRNTIEFLGIWEQIYNPAFKPLEFERFRNQAGLNSFSLSPKKWIEATGAIGLYAKSGRGGGTFAHRDIAFEFGSWLSPEFKLYLIKEFQRLKDAEARTEALDWNFQRTLAKVNYKIHTDAIKERLIPPRLTKAQTSMVYASEPTCSTPPCLVPPQRSGGKPTPGRSATCAMPLHWNNWSCCRIWKASMPFSSTREWPRPNAWRS